MTETKKSKKSLIILLIPPLLNYLDWKKDSKNQYFFLSDIIDRQEKLVAWQKKSDNLVQWAEILNKEMVYNDKVTKILDDSGQSRIILVNYPRNKESLQTLEKELWIRERQPIFFFVSFNRKLEADFAELKNENVICPLCEKSWRKKDTMPAERENIFRCPEDKVEFNLAETEKTTQYLLNDYFERAAQIIEYQKTKKNKIITLELSIKPDFEPENLHQYLLEKLAKEADDE